LVLQTCPSFFLPAGHKNVLQYFCSSTAEIVQVNQDADNSCLLLLWLVLLYKRCLWLIAERNRQKRSSPKKFFTPKYWSSRQWDSVFFGSTLSPCACALLRTSKYCSTMKTQANEKFGPLINGMCGTCGVVPSSSYSPFYGPVQLFLAG
jgi:hypothetical protein